MMSPSIGLLDPSVDSRNAGDQIISEAVQAQLKTIGIDAVAIFPTHRLLTRPEMQAFARCEKYLIGGSNILDGALLQNSQWKVRPSQWSRMRGRTAVVGAGWHGYQKSTSRASAYFWKQLLSPAVPQSVRDSYTQSKLAQLGIPAANTGCPTMWNLPPVVNSRKERPNSVVFTLTDYSRDFSQDRLLIMTLKSIYKEVIFWPQSARDASYVQSMDIDVEIGRTGLGWYSTLLENPDLDYCGTRLHGGIRALQTGKRAVVVAIDNRAQEIAFDTGLPVVQRGEVTPSAVLHALEPAPLSMPNSIVHWKEKFRDWAQS